MYSHERYMALVKKTVDQVIDLGIKKGGEYSGDDDRLANFRRNGLAAGVPMELIWRVYASKHWDAIMQYEHDIRTGKTRDRLEKITGRIDDLIVYLLLFKAMIDERESGVQEKFPKKEEKPYHGLTPPRAIKIPGETRLEAYHRYKITGISFTPESWAKMATDFDPQEFAEGYYSWVKDSDSISE